tara:strand:+ start:28 stop:363 length:336 start_codon:yes stop_codon:yes gene_type:complete
MDRRKPTVQMLGRYQPWHDGHTELFKRAYSKTGQVCIMVRDTGEQYHNKLDIIHSLEKAGFQYKQDYDILEVPNIVNITYGRDVGYKIEQESFSKEIEDISATKIREKSLN